MILRQRVWRLEIELVGLLIVPGGRDLQVVHPL